ncbi:hypothetical protein [Aquimarina sediminis]|uniref:hypothetical protein n=1 Tax=Aquimarina sediminis TaxID=2070536 RepID=UPI000CA03B76|nr:hypothetical protein [Aquimarina sediminis]
MKNKRKIITTLLVSACVYFLWFLYIKEYDYTITIKANTSPGVVYTSVMKWANDLESTQGVKTIHLSDKKFSSIHHTSFLDSLPLFFEWKIRPLTDSLTEVKIGVKNPNNAIRNRLQKLVISTPLEKRIHKEFISFNNGLIKHVEEFKVKIKGKSASPEAYVAYVNIACDQKEKATYMLRNSGYINSFLKEHNIKLVANPFIEISNWDIENEKLQFSFCFPISKMDHFPLYSDIKYKKVVSEPSIKAVFYGNYSFSDRSWYALHQYAINNNIEIKPSLVEVFYNNPHVGGNDLEWKAEIFMKIN